MGVVKKQYLWVTFLLWIEVEVAPVALFYWPMREKEGRMGLEQEQEQEQPVDRMCMYV